MIIPFQAVTSFNDPSIGFGLQFGMLEDGDDEDGLSMDDTSSAAVAKTHDGNDTGEHGDKDAKPDDEKTCLLYTSDAADE